MSTLDRHKSIYEHIMESDTENCQRVFNSYDKDGRGFIDYYDLKQALEEVGIHFSHPNIYYKMLADMSDQSGQITFFDFTKMVVQRKKNTVGADEGILDAYIALGGDEDGGGNIDADKLIDVIKNEFEMTIDIEGLIRQIDEDQSGEIEFEEFQTLLENDNGDNPNITKLIYRA